MSQATQTQTAKVAFVFAPVTPEAARNAAGAMVSAIGKYEKAKVTLMGALADACKLIGVPLTSAQYDKQVRPYLADAFKAAARSKNSAVTDGTVTQYASKLKTAVLAILSKAAEPHAGESFFAFYDRAAKALPSATFTVGEGDNAQTVKVWNAETAKGRKAGAKVGRKGVSLPGAVADANASAATSGEGGFNRKPAVAAALILTGNNEARAQRLVVVMQSYASEFDRWCASILTDQDKAEIAAASKAPDAKPEGETVTIKAGESAETALAAALIEGQRKLNAGEGRKPRSRKVA